MIQASGLTKEFASRILFQNIGFTVNKNERIGLVGRNGTGKSTLLKIITKEIDLDAGEISYPKNYSVEMLQQHIEFTEDTVLKECMLALTKEEQHDFYKAEKILFGLGFEQEDLQKSPLSFSGGYQIRILLTKCLLKAPDMLLLDEPTNYLDIVSMRWLERFLRKYPGEIILITHDREFMNAVCTHTMGIHRNKLIKVKGSYQKYWEKIQEDEAIHENTRQNQEKKRKELETFINKFRAKARQASLAQSRQKMLDKMEEFDRLENISSIKFQFNYKDFPAKTFLQTQNLGFGYTDELLFSDLSFYINKGDKIAIIGKNGKGKSTLLNLLGDNLSPKVGSIQRHNSVAIGHFGQTHINTLHMDNTIEQEIISVNSDLSKTAVRNICGSMMFSGDDAEKKISVLSGGEKSRVLLGKILAKQTNLLLLDEPTNHLDQESIEILIDELKNFQGAVVIVTHNEHILKRLASKFIVFHHDKCEEFVGSYDDFLNKIGWEEQEEQTEEVTEKISHKEYKHLRSELIKERSSKTKPLKTKIEKLENEIESLDKQVEIANQNLVKASENEDGQAIQENSKLLSEAQDKIEENFEQLEALSDELQTLEEFFNEKLESLEARK
jgi:ATP-binding cassette subfamily F protein 3